MTGLTVGFAMCGSYCTFDEAIETLESLTGLHRKIIPIMSENAYSTDTRFGAAAGFIGRVEEITGAKIIHTITAAEPIGPQKLLDILVIAPCTGNTLSKLAAGITDTAVTMAAKAHLRNARPLVIAVSTNDALSANAKNIGELMTRRNVYFAPMYQDDPIGKPTSLLSRLELLPETISAAMEGRQIQPVFTVDS